MQITSERQLDHDVLERRFTLGEVPGILWSPAGSTAPTPLVLVGHPGGLDQMYPRVAGRAQHYVVEHGFAAATIELPGSGERPRSLAADEARADLRRALAAGEPVDDIVDALVLPLVDQAVPEWQAALDVLLSLDEVGGPVGYEGGVLAIGVRLARVEPRVAAAVLFAGTFLPRSMLEEAREVSIPLRVLLQWDDAVDNRAQVLELFDTLGSQEKSLHANLGGHTGVPRHEVESAGRFFARHLGAD